MPSKHLQISQNTFSKIQARRSQQLQEMVSEDPVVSLGRLFFFWKMVGMVLNRHEEVTAINMI